MHASLTMHQLVLVLNFDLFYYYACSLGCAGAPQYSQYYIRIQFGSIVMFHNTKLLHYYHYFIITVYICALLCTWNAITILILIISIAANSTTSPLQYTASSNLVTIYTDIIVYLWQFPVARTQRNIQAYIKVMEVYILAQSKRESASALHLGAYTPFLEEQYIAIPCQLLSVRELRDTMQYLQNSR